MQRRQSHPHSQFTGLIVIISMMFSVGIMFWLPGQPERPAEAAAVATTATLSLPITRTPRTELGPEANAQEEELAIDWSTIPTAIPADQFVAEGLTATAAAQPPTPVPIIQQAQPEIIYQPAERIVITQAPLVVVEQGQRVVQTATPIVLANQDPPPAAPAVVNPNDFANPGPPSCNFVGALSCPQATPRGTP